MKYVKQRRNYQINIANFFASNLNFLLLLDNIPSLNRLNRPGYRKRRFTRTLAMEWGHLGGPSPHHNIWRVCVYYPPTWLNRVVLILHLFAILNLIMKKVVVAIFALKMTNGGRLLQHSVCKCLEMFHFNFHAKTQGVWILLIFKIAPRPLRSLEAKNWKLENLKKAFWGRFQQTK